MRKIFNSHEYRIREARPLILDPKNRRTSFDASFGPPRTINISTPKERNDLYFSHTSGVEAHEASAILLGIRRLIQEVGSKIQIKNFGDFYIDDRPFGNSDWYQAQAKTNKQRGHGPQIEDLKLIRLLHEEPYQEHHPHMDVMIFDQDLRSDEANNNFIYGSASYPHYVMSVRRFRDRMSDLHLRQIAMAIMAAHELGHNFGLVGRNFNTVFKLGSHCNGQCGPCLMEQVDYGPGTRTLEDQSRLLVGQVRWLCDDCLDEAGYKKQDLEEKGILW